MENTYPDPGPNTNILDDADFSLYQANGGKRFANWLIDRIILYIFWRIFFATIAIKIAAGMYSEGDSLGVIYAKIYLMVVILDLFMWTALEFLGRGKTIGKLITGTRAVNQDGTQITFKTALLRSLSRIV